MRKIDNNITTRRLRATDKQSFINLKLKEGDATELYNMLGISVKEYLEWHYTEHRLITTGIFYKGKLFGFICITDEGTMCFLTSKVTNTSLKYSMVRYFKQVLSDEMKERGADKVHVYMDKSYSVAKKWAINGGFKDEGAIDVLPDFELLTYCRQNVAN